MAAPVSSTTQSSKLATALGCVFLGVGSGLGLRVFTLSLKLKCLKLNAISSCCGPTLGKKVNTRVHEPEIPVRYSSLLTSAFLQ